MSPAMELLKKLVASDAAQIEAAIAQLVDAWNRHDSVACAAGFASEADFVNVLGAHWRGRQEIAERHAELHRTVMRNSTLHILHHAVRFLTDSVALAHVKWEQEGHEPPPGWNVGEVRQGVLSLVFVKEASDWMIASAHNTDVVTLPH